MPKKELFYKKEQQYLNVRSQTWHIKINPFFMDYIALNHQAQNIYGVHYNSPQPIGGIRYYDGRERPVKVDETTGKTQVVIATPAVEPKLKSQNLDVPKPKEVQSTRQEIKQITYEDLKDEIQSQIEDEDWQTAQAKDLEKTLELISEENLKNELDENLVEQELDEEIFALDGVEKNYLVQIQDEEIDFSKVGIQKTRISRNDMIWLKKAQNYFLTVKEDGIKIGSAESFTTMEILEALWRTAEQVGTDPKRYIVQVYNESRFNPEAKGRSGERGLGQFKKSTAKHYGYDWDEMTNGIKGYAYQAKAAAEFVKKVGEIAYNGGGDQAERYRDKISVRIDSINDWDSSCVMRTLAYCAES